MRTAFPVLFPSTLDRGEETNVTTGCVGSTQILTEDYGAVQFMAMVLSSSAGSLEEGLRGRHPDFHADYPDLPMRFLSSHDARSTAGTVPDLSTGTSEGNEFSVWRSKLDESRRIDFGATKRKDSLFPGDGPSLDASSNQISPHLSCLLAVFERGATSRKPDFQGARAWGALAGKGHCIVLAPLARGRETFAEGSSRGLRSTAALAR